MGDSFTFGSLAGHYAAFALFAVISIGCGFAAAQAAGKWPHAGSRGRSRWLGKSAIAGVLVAGALLAIVWYWLWSGFHILEIADGRVILHYHMPLRERVIAPEDVVDVRWQPAPKSTRRLTIRLRNGNEYFSMQSGGGSTGDAALLESVRRAIRPS